MKFSLYLLTLTFLFTFNVACNDTASKTGQAPVEVHQTQGASVTSATTNGPFAHTVYFWLNQPQSPLANLAFQNSIKKFILNSPDITTYHLGKPADTDRPVIDNTYTYALLLTFEDKDAQDRYQDDPAHKIFIKESEALWSKVVVYDSENILN